VRAEARRDAGGAGIASGSGAFSPTRCSQTVLDFLSTGMDMGGGGGGGDPAHVRKTPRARPEWELRKGEQREEETRLEAEVQGTEIEERLQIFATPLTRDLRGRVVRKLFLLPFLLPLLFCFPCR